MAFSGSRQMVPISHCPPIALVVLPGPQTWLDDGNQERVLDVELGDLGQSSLIQMLRACHLSLSEPHYLIYKMEAQYQSHRVVLRVEREHGEKDPSDYRCSKRNPVEGEDIECRIHRQVFFFFHTFWPHPTACRIQFPDQGLNPGPLHREHRVLATGPLGKSQCICFKAYFHCCYLSASFYSFPSIEMAKTLPQNFIILHGANIPVETHNYLLSVFC